MHVNCHACLKDRFGSTFDTNKDLYVIIMRNVLIFKIFGRAIFEVVEVKGRFALYVAFWNFDLNFFPRQKKEHS
jgi:hypothetical protein